MHGARKPLIHRLASVAATAHIGDGTRVWQFAVILRGAQIGEDCNICAHTFIESDVRVGDRVTVKCGVQLWDGTRIEDDVFIGPNATFTNDPWPRSRDHLAEYRHIVVKAGASIGANATILPGITIGEDAMVGAGAVVTKDVRAGTIVVGSPARETGEEVTVRGVVSARRTEPPTGVLSPHADEAETVIPWPGPGLFNLTMARDERGSLAALEFEMLPFKARRIFVVYDVPEDWDRGAHAHRDCQQLLVALRGQVKVTCETARKTTHWLLNRPGQGLYVPPMTWAEQAYGNDALLLVLADRPYDPADYIRNREEFDRLCATS